MKVRSLLFALAIISITLPLWSQSGSSSQPSLSPSEVYLWNSVNKPLSFSIQGNKCGSLNTSLNGDASGSFTCDGAEFFNIRIGTEINGQVTWKDYSLDPAARYKLFKNANGIFDIAKL